MIPLERRVSHRAARCRPRPVRIHQKMRVVPPSEAGDSVSQDMLDGSAASKRRKFDLPTPLIESVDDYTDGIRPDFKTPATYIRHRPREAEAMREKVLFTLSPDDRAWIAERAAQTGKAALLTPELFEKMIVLMEHRAFERGATAAEKEHDSACLSQADAEELFFSELHFVGAASQKLIADVRARWLAARAKHRKPVLRRYWPTTAATDTNPHMVFRAREKERYKLRKSRRNDAEACERMKRLRDDMIAARAIVEALREREELKKIAAGYQREAFLQGAHELECPGDVTGKRRKLEVKLRPKKKRRRRKKKGGLKLKLTLGGTSGEAKRREDEERRRKLEAQRAAGFGETPMLPDFMYPTFAPDEYPSAPCASFPDIPVWPPPSSDEESERERGRDDGRGGGSPGPGTHPSGARGVRAPRPRERRYVCRPRIARGGRVVIDRLPLPRFRRAAGLGRPAAARRAERERQRRRLARQRKVREETQDAVAAAGRAGRTARAADRSDKRTDAAGADAIDEAEGAPSVLGVGQRPFAAAQRVFAVAGAALGGRGLWGWGAEPVGGDPDADEGPGRPRERGRGPKAPRDRGWWGSLGLGPLPPHEPGTGAPLGGSLRALRVKAARAAALTAGGGAGGRDEAATTRAPPPYDAPMDADDDGAEAAVARLRRPVYARAPHRVALTSGGGALTSGGGAEARAPRGTALASIAGLVNRRNLERIYALSDSEDEALVEDVDEASGKDYHSDVVRVLGKPVKYAFNFRV
jgi:enhancer of polycomb-like protein